MLKLLLKQSNSLSNWLKIPKQQAKLQPKQKYKQQTMQQLVHELIKTTVQKVSANQLVKVEMGDNDNQMADKTGKKI